VNPIDQVLERIRLSEEWRAQVACWRVLEARPAAYGQWPQALDPRLARMSQAQGIERPYTHQAEAIERALGGAHVVIVTPTASGKSLCYNLPVLQALLQDPTARALYLFPTKALAHDQLHQLQTHIASLGVDMVAEAYDGDTPSSRRAAIRRQARVLISNPDMLHAGILPYHTRWHEFLSGLRYVVLDELHHYRGIFGSHVANVLRRLTRICQHYGSQPQFICCSATIANPREFAERLIERPVELVARNGAPQHPRVMLLYNPPVVNVQLGLRRSPLMDARSLANLLLEQDAQSVVFARSRLSAELLLTYLRQDAVRNGRDPAAVRGYRGGYLPRERRAIEGDLRSGRVRAIVATNALELGINIGGLSACVMVGYPGSIASCWQQAGRVGRMGERSLALLVASASPLDQYIIAHPDYIFGRSPERALINPDNLHVLLGHLRCAAYELPFSQEEGFGTEDAQELLRFLAEGGQARSSGDKWFWVGGDYPAGQVSLRTAEPSGVVILADQEGGPATIGQIDRASAARWLHEGAIYLHEGQQYQVEQLDWEGGMARVRSASVDYYTEASESTRITIERTHEQRTSAGVTLARGEVLITSRATSYRRLRLGSQEHLGWGEIDLPEQSWLTSACWLTLSDSLVEHLRDVGLWMGEVVVDRGPSWPLQRDRARLRDGYRCRWCGAPERDGRQHDVHHVTPFREFGWRVGENENHLQANALENLITLCTNCHRRAEQQVAEQSALARIARVLGNVAPLILMCDPRDIGLHTELQSSETRLATLFLFDRIPGGAGLSDEAFAQWHALLESGNELIRDCPCTEGCPACIGPIEDADKETKQRILLLIAFLQNSMLSMSGSVSVS
jgi:DEAD/DEAH box helicase domain-containing protein